MAQRSSKLGLALIVNVVMLTCSWAQPTCQPPIISLQPCVGFITSNSLTPSRQCCTQLESFAQTQAQCMCAFLNAAPQLPLPVNTTQALSLPGACNIQAPPLSQCNAPSTASAGSPQGAPAADSPATQPDADAPLNPSTTGVPVSQGGSEAGQNKGQQPSSAISSTKFSPLFFFFLFVASSFYSI
ncbi:uncharacterized protein A4U43_C07F32700 [Asparagus officinalis]|uniref:Bifunctional inhibitor/plant lipid transfer protein/seed storage helical domain-containing protein n=1 Tax=Asparagus officinalis TaxID=4686 RepID=A0A5P1EGK1_ASPOF|nr:non-specific lipid-transfer protein-like protein At2g13820 [Asparagus officinalis]ONK65026.1 uncharacterized protein A4U43_C07F32700 [Asparagus officinalis]